jgi:hypothetical protein
VFWRALAIREAALPPPHPSTATSLTKLADALRKQGRFVDAEACYCRALGIYELALPAAHPDVAHCRDALTITRECLRCTDPLADVHE